MDPAKRVDVILENLRGLVDSTQVNQTLLQREIKNFEQIALSTKTIHVGFVGPSGSGKSTLLNRIIGVEILPASSSGISCTSSILKIRKQVDLGNNYEVTTHHFDKDELSEILFPAFEDETVEASKDDDAEEEEHCTKTKRKLRDRKKLAKRIIKDLWKGRGDAPTQGSQNVLDLIPEEFRSIYMKHGGRKVRYVTDDENDITAHIRSCTESAKMYFIKNIEIRGAFTQMHEQLCLVDIPGSGDTLFLANVMRQGIDQSDLVVCVEEQNRVSNGKVMERLDELAPLLQKKLGFALCISKSGQGFKDYEKALKSNKKRVKSDPSAEQPSETNGESYQRIQKEQFRQALKDHESDTHEFYKDAEIYLLENDDTQEEPEFSKQERNKFESFINTVANNPDTLRIIDGNIDAAVANAKSRLTNPLVPELDDNCIQAIQGILTQGYANEALPFIRKGKRVDAYVLKAINSTKSYAYFHATLKSPDNANVVKYYAPIPVWECLLASAVNLPLLVESNRVFQKTYLSVVNEKIQRIRLELIQRLNSEEKANFCINRLQTFLVHVVSEDMESSSKILKASKLENKLTREFWHRVPMVVKGTGMVAKNTENITEFINDNLEQAKSVLQRNLEEKHFTLNASLARAATAIGDQSTWLLQVDHNSQNDGGIRQIQLALEGKVDELNCAAHSEEQQDEDKVELKLELLKAFDAVLQEKYEVYCRALSTTTFKLRRPTPEIVAAAMVAPWFYVAETKAKRGFIKIGYSETNTVPNPLDLLFAKRSRLPQLCTRIMSRVFGNAKKHWLHVDKEVALEVAQMVHGFVELVCDVWQILQ